MASANILVSTSSASSSAMNSTKVKVISTTAVYYAVGESPVAYSSGNCAMLPANVIRDVILGPGNIIAKTGPKIAFVAASGTGTVNITEVGSVNFNNIPS